MNIQEFIEKYSSMLGLSNREIAIELKKAFKLEYTIYQLEGYVERYLKKGRKINISID
jgi:hypothetical protein